MDIKRLAILGVVASLAFSQVKIAEAGEGTFVVAEPSVSDASDGNDPLETFNRGIFSFNEALLKYVLNLIAAVYSDYVPDPVQDGIGNVLSNLNSPAILANDILQSEFVRAGETAARLVVNSTIGIGGLLDVGDRMGLEAHTEDLGQTLAVWGVGEGFYLVLPLLGPSNPRDAIGKFGQGYFDPLSQWTGNTGRDGISHVRSGMSGLDKYSGVVDGLDEIKKTSLDYYATIRSLYRQNRLSEIRNGREEDLPPIPDFGFGDNEDGPEDNRLSANALP